MLKQREKEEKELKEKLVKERKKFNVYMLFILIGLGVGLFYVFKWGTVIGYVIYTILSSVIYFLVWSKIKKLYKE